VAAPDRYAPGWQIARLPWPWQVVLLVAGISAGPVILELIHLAESSGQYVPVDSVSADYLLGLCGALILGFTVFLLPGSSQERRAYVVLWVAKVVVCLVLMLPYEAHYDFLDAYGYFSDSINREYTDDLLGFAVGTKAISKLFEMVWTVLPPSYHLAKVLCAYVGLLAILLLYRSYVRVTGARAVGPLYVLGLFPSLLFWSSILGKDPLILFGIGTAFYAGIARLRSGKWTIGTMLAILFGIAVATIIRLWMGAILVATFLFTVVMEKTRPERRTAVVLTMLAALCLAVYVASSIGIFEEAQFLLQLESVSNGWAIGGSGSGPVVLDTWGSVLRFFPLGAFTALFRPLPGEVLNVFGILAGVENLLLLGLSGWAVWRWRRHWFRRPEVIWLCAYVSIWTSVYAFISYQNLGTAVRFKAQVLPAMLILIGFARVHAAARPDAAGGHE
jgi:hypothetical protein